MLGAGLGHADGHLWQLGTMPRGLMRAPEADLRKRNRMRPTTLYERSSARRAHVSHPLRTVPEHRDEIALASVSRDDEDGCAEASAAPVFHLQGEQDAGHQTKAGYPGSRSAPNSPETCRAPASVEVAQVTAPFGWIFALRHQNV